MPFLPQPKKFMPLLKSRKVSSSQLQPTRVSEYCSNLNPSLPKEHKNVEQKQNQTKLFAAVILIDLLQTNSYSPTQATKKKILLLYHLSLPTEEGKKVFLTITHEELEKKPRFKAWSDFGYSARVFMYREKSVGTHLEPRTTITIFEEIPQNLTKKCQQNKKPPTRMNKMCIFISFFVDMAVALMQAQGMEQKSAKSS